MQKITSPTTLRPVEIARLLEQQGSPLAPLAEEIYDLAIAYRIDAAFALAQCMVESQLGCRYEAQRNRNAALVRVALARLAAPTGPLHPVGTAEPILPPRYGDEHGSGYVTYPGWLAGLEEYFRLLREVFVNAWREDKVEQVARAYLEATPGRKPAPHAPQPALVGAALALRAAGQGQSAERSRAAPVSQKEIDAYARRVERYRAAFQAR
jgi:hypothetical protein